MQVPAILYGDAKDVRRCCREVLRNWLKSDVSYIEAMEANGVLDVADFREPLTLEFGPREYGFGLFLAAPTYCLFSGPQGLILNQRKPYPPSWWSLPRLVEFFDASLTRPWALLSLICTQNAHLLFWAGHSDDLDRCRRLVASVLRDCEELESVGPRYAGLYPTYFSKEALKVYQCLRTLGALTEHPRNLLGGVSQNAPEPKGGLRGVLAALGVSVDAGWAAERLPDRPAVPTPPASPPPPPPYDPAEHEMSVALRAALEARDAAGVRRLIEAGESPNHYHPEQLITPLFWAIRQGDIALVEFLLDHGADIEDRADEGESPLMQAAYRGHRDIVRLLLDRGARPRYRTDKGWSVLEYADMGKDVEIQAMVTAAYKAKVRGTPTKRHY